MYYLVADKSIPFINRFLQLSIRIRDGIVCKALDIICIPLHLIQPLFDFIPEAANLPLRAIRQVTVAPAPGCRRRASLRGIWSTGFKAKSPCHSWDYECTQADNEVQFSRIVHQMLKPIRLPGELRYHSHQSGHAGAVGGPRGYLLSKQRPECRKGRQISRGPVPITRAALANLWTVG